MIDINGKNYIINMEKLFDFVMKPSKGNRTEQEITDGYDVNEEGTLSPVSKVVREIKSKGDQTEESYRYDFIRILIAQLLEVENSEDFVFGDELALVTLMRYKIIQEI